MAGDDILSMNEEDLLQESGEIKKWARDFDRDLQDATTRITNMTWEGGSGDSFRGVFKTANDQFDLVRKQIDDGIFGKLVNAESNISRES